MATKSDGLTAPGLFWPFFPFMHLDMAPQSLQQPINPNWNLGTMIFNYENSKDPRTEQAVLSRYSYGRQLGRLLDVVEVLLKQQGDDEKAREAVEQFTSLLAGVREEKEKVKKSRMEELKAELEALEKDDPEAYEKLLDRR